MANLDIEDVFNFLIETDDYLLLFIFSSLLKKINRRNEKEERIK